MNITKKLLMDQYSMSLLLKNLLKWNEAEESPRAQLSDYIWLRKMGAEITKN